MKTTHYIFYAFEQLFLINLYQERSKTNMCQAWMFQQCFNTTTVLYLYKTCNYRFFKVFNFTIENIRHRTIFGFKICVILFLLLICLSKQKQFLISYTLSIIYIQIYNTSRGIVSLIKVIYLDSYAIGRPQQLKK